MTRARLPCSLHFPDQSLRTKVSIIQNVFFSRSHEFTNKASFLSASLHIFRLLPASIGVRSFPACVCIKSIYFSSILCTLQRLLELARTRYTTRHFAFARFIFRTKKQVLTHCCVATGSIVGVSEFSFGLFSYFSSPSGIYRRAFVSGVRLYQVYIF